MNEILNASDWDFKGCDTQYGVHGIHTYVAAMIPQLARKLIDLFAPEKGAVLDPFCGGGAVLAEAILSGRIAVGRDVNQLAVLISKAKTTHLPEGEVSSTFQQILDKTDHSLQPPLIGENLAYWFKEEHLGTLHSLRSAIANVVDPDDRMLPLVLTVFSATVRDVSLTYRNEIRLRRMSPEEIENFNIDPLERFRVRAERAADAVSDLPDHSIPDVESGTVQSIGLEDNSISAIVCSPPYGDERNGVSYSQFSKNMLAWLGHSQEDIRHSKNQTLGWGNSVRSCPTSRALESSLSAINGFPNSVKEAVAFYADYQTALVEMARVSEGPIIIVIGKRVLRDTIFDNGAITIDLMQNIGVPLRERFYRSLPSKRLPKMRKFGAAINSEDILVFQP